MAELLQYPEYVLPLGRYSTVLQAEVCAILPYPGRYSTVFQAQVCAILALYSRQRCVPSLLIHKVMQCKVRSSCNTFSFHFNGHFLAILWVSRYQNVSILDFIGAKGDEGGGDNWSYRKCKSPVKSSPPTSQHPKFYRPDALPVAQPTVSKH